MRWSFPSNNKGDINGIGHSGIETFQGTPLKSLAREICQNSLDAVLKEQTAKVEFMPFVLDIAEFPNAESLNGAFKASLKFWSVQEERRPTEFFKRAIQVMESGSIPFLRVSDFNTAGLRGSRREFYTPWCNLTKSSGASDKAGSSGGSFGIGKFAPFSCSELRTVFYSTLDIDGETAFQGVSRITSFRREDGEITVGVGYYGADDNQPVYSQLHLDPGFKRGIMETGTDIFIAGFRYYSMDWKESIIGSVLDGFLYAVFAGKLVVRVADIVIDRDSLPNLISEYRHCLDENADKYYSVLTSNETSWYETDFQNMGHIRLGLLIQSDQHEMDMHRKVAMIRKTGMKIMDRGNISGITPFAGVMIIEGERINSFLRNIENPQHTKWEPERMQPPNRIPFARSFLLELRNYITSCLNELKKENPIDEIDPDVGEYLPDEGSSGEDAQEAESLTDTIRTVDVDVPPRTKPCSTASPGEEPAKMDDGDGEIVEEDAGSGAGHREGKNRAGGLGGGVSSGEGHGENPKPHTRSLVAISSSKTRFVCLDKDNGKYSVTFVPKASADDGYFDLFLSAETQVYEAPIVSVKDMGHAELTVEGNKITGMKFVADRPIRLLVTIDHGDYCSMEVRAYGHTS